MLRVIVKLSDSVTNEFKTDQNEIIIGRDPGSDIQIDNIAISREHARIVKGPNDYFIEDLNSINGIFIDGRKFNKKFLISPEDVSSTLLKFMCEEYDYFLVDKEGKRYNYMEEPIE